MAIWQFSFHYVPHVGAVQELTSRRLSDDEGNELIERRAPSVPDESVARLRTVLGLGRTWLSDLEVLGDLESTCVKILRSGGEIAEVSGRIDMRCVSACVVEEMLKFADDAGCVLLTQGNMVVRPVLSELAAEIRQSSAYAYASDPRAFFALLANAEGEDGVLEQGEQRRES